MKNFMIKVSLDLHCLRNFFEIYIYQRIHTLYLLKLRKFQNRKYLRQIPIINNLSLVTIFWFLWSFWIHKNGKTDINWVFFSPLHSFGLIHHFTVEIREIILFIFFQKRVNLLETILESFSTIFFANLLIANHFCFPKKWKKK